MTTLLGVAGVPIVRPILFSIGNFYVGSYAAMLFLAVVTAIVTTVIRARRRALDTTLLAPALTVGLISGWVFGRASLLTDPAARGVGWRVFSPMQGGGGSLTYFGVGAAIGVIIFLLLRRQPVLPTADAVAPSILFAVGIAKIGCLMSGCCEGALCSNAFGITYPYGSAVHERHLTKNLVAVPDDLKCEEADSKSERLTFGHLQVLRYETKIGTSRGTDERSVVTTELVARASEYRSLPVWPLPIMASIAAIACGIAAEFVFRRSTKQGTTLAFVLCAYGAIRLILDWLLADRGHVAIGMSAAQWIGAFAFAIGWSIYVAGRSRRAN